MKDKDFWETPLSGDQFHYNNEEVYLKTISWIKDGLAAMYAFSYISTKNRRNV